MPSERLFCAGTFRFSVIFGSEAIAVRFASVLVDYEKNSNQFGRIRRWCLSCWRRFPGCAQAAPGFPVQRGGELDLMVSHGGTQGVLRGWLATIRARRLGALDSSLTHSNWER